MSDRIQWEPDGQHAFRGSVGRCRDLFGIHWSSVRGDPDWILDTRLAGMESRIAKDDSRIALERIAAGWLEEYAASLGAVFPGPDDSPAISEAERWQLAEYRSLLAGWDAGRGGDGLYTTDRTLADALRDLLAIVDRLAPGTEGSSDE